jgi:hypothetical protein
MDRQVQELLAFAFDKWTLVVAGGVFFFFRLLRQTPIVRWPVYWRLLPVLPETLGSAIALLGGIPVVADQPVLIKIAVGLWCGYLSQRAHKVLGQTILGDDPDIIRSGKTESIKIRSGEGE